jgi:hypothetical protein
MIMVMMLMMIIMKQNSVAVRTQAVFRILPFKDYEILDKLFDPYGLNFPHLKLIIYIFDKEIGKIVIIHLKMSVCHFKL